MVSSLAPDGIEGNESLLSNTRDDVLSISVADGLSPDVLSNSVADADFSQTLQTQNATYLLETTSNLINITDLSRQSSASFNESQSINGTLAGAEEFKFSLFGTYIYPLQWLTLSTLSSWLRPLSSIAMIIGCVMPYVPQYITIYKIKNCSGFSTFVCLTLLSANILRIAFWFGHPFETPLLVQSAIMILAQILLLELCVRTKGRNLDYRQKKKTLFSHPRFFWRWTKIISYIEFLCLIAFILGLAMYFLINCQPFVEATGYLALVTESMLGLPQVIKNFKKKSVEGMSLSMVLMWLGGDIFKTVYFIVNNVPLQFWLCGVLQITIDLLILFQVCLFRRNAPLKVRDRPKEMMAL